ncbi:hypothetical protein N568_0107750 [Lactococcus garvieae TRF1]|uniref:Uncharacterized protein n=1 Tax=Lactococcus garvieae TRF1 TaxID=1380772 RepID=V8ANV0_9LACT|nr:hypothetical protein N568_0107750 [Lactococcus garvieae TRF1]
MIRLIGWKWKSCEGWSGPVLIARGLYQVIEHMSLALLIYQEIVI